MLKTGIDGRSEVKRWISILLGYALLHAVVLTFPVAALAGESSEDDEEITSSLKQAFTRDHKGGVLVLDSKEDAEDDDGGGAGDAESCDKPEKEDRYPEGSLFGMLEYRFSETNAGDVTETGNDLGITFGYGFDLDRHWDFTVALHSGADTRPTTGWINLDDPGGQQWLHLREYWGRYSGEVGKDTDIEIIMGSFAQPHVPSQLVFDSDLHRPGAGVELTWEPEAPGLDRARFSVTGMRLRTGKDGLDAADVISTQLDLRWELSKQTRLETGVAHHDFRDPAGVQQAVLDGDWRVGGLPGQGETTNYTEYGGALSSDYRILDAWIGTEFFRETEWPLEIELEYVKNTAAGELAMGRDSAWLAAASIGEDNDPGDWQFGAEYTEIEADAVLAAANRGSYASNSRSTRLDVRYVPWEDVTWRLTRQWSESLDGDAPLGEFSEDQWKFYVTYEW
jgi:hypothetical protein